MKWIYDESKAREHLQEYETAVEQENARREKENKRMNFFHSLWIIGTLAIAAILILLICFLWTADENGLKPLAIFGVSLISAFVIAMVTLYFADERYTLLDEESQQYWKPLPADVEYLLATDGKKVLSRECTKDFGDITVWVTLEDEKHFVSTTRAGHLKRKVSTSVTEIVADLTSGVYLIPYNSRLARGRKRHEAD